jgi:LacI family transcriptional regulator, galactose operon repressor
MTGRLRVDRRQLVRHVSCEPEVMVEKRHTIKSIADRAGVATATVARVLHNNGYVAEATRQKVLKAVAETDYRINHIARSLKRNRSNVVGHILKSTMPNPFYVAVARGVEAYCRENGYTALTYNVEGDLEAERNAVETFLNWRVDAIIFTTPTAAQNVELALNSRKPVVQVERPQTDRSDRITVDNYHGARAAMQHLLELGHRRIGFVGPEPDPAVTPLAKYVELERYGAFRDILLDAGLFDEDLVFVGRSYSLEELEARQVPLSDGYRALQTWWSTSKPPTAVFASSDFLAAGVLQAAGALGLKVPDDLSVIGFDDTLSTFLSPLLTSVRLPAYELGRAAARLAIDRLGGEGGTAPVEQKLAATLVQRASVGPARRG